MPSDGLPDDGELRLGSVTLPAGRRIMSRYGDSNEPVAWATIQSVPDVGTVWQALAGMRQETGLVPVLLGGLGGGTKRPWDDGEFDDPEDIGELDRLEAAQVLETSWADSLEELDEEAEEDPEAIAEREPFTRQFPGLAPPGDTLLSPVQLQQALGSLLPARLGLVAAGRPADVLPRIGWTGVTNRHETSLPIAAVLRSWEDRYGARLLEVGFAEIRLLVERPPQSLDAARRIAAEHYAFCDECGGQGLSNVPEIAAGLVNAPIWTFWWD